VTLDRKRPYCTVYGDPIVRFEQDGKKFTRDGQQVVIVEPSDMPQEVKLEVKLTGKARRDYFRNLMKGTDGLAGK
jgi:hypothetical protein